MRVLQPVRPPEGGAVSHRDEEAMTLNNIYMLLRGGRKNKKLYNQSLSNTCVRPVRGKLPAFTGLAISYSGIGEKTRS